jgi:hypothetical protein
MNPQDPDDPQMWERVIRWWEGPDHNPRHMDPDLLEWVLTHHPKWIKMEVNQEWINARIKELEAQGVENRAGFERSLQEGPHLNERPYATQKTS